MQIFGNNVRLSIYVPPHGIPYTQYRDLWRTAEAQGFDGAFLTDHMMGWSGGDLGPASRVSVFEGPALLAAMAASTTRLRIGVNVIGNTFRHPGHLAKIATTIDHISNGRLEFGIGAAHTIAEHDQYNIPFYTTGRRLRMLAESVRQVRLLLTQDTTSFEGKYYTLREAICEPKPVQNPLPIIIGGLGEELTLRVVAESADIWNVHLLLPLEEYQHKLGVLAQHCKEFGRNPEDIRKSMILRAVVDDTEAAAQARVGDRTRQGALIGTPEQVAERLLEYVKIGIGDFMFSTANPFDTRTQELIASKVAPILRAEGKAILDAR